MEWTELDIEVYYGAYTRSFKTSQARANCACSAWATWMTAIRY